MSYNYLPLDRKRLHFQQVKNLLNYNQLVSITFDAHERILKCREYLDNAVKDKSTGSEQKQSAFNIIKNNAVGIGEEVPVDIVKLMLMLKIKSLSYGYGGVQIETVKRLMEMYNSHVFPVIHSVPAVGGRVDAALAELSLPLIGLGQVYYNGQKRGSEEVFKELSWRSLDLKKDEVYALITGTHFMTAYGLYILKKTEQLLKMADAVAALSFDAFDCSIESLYNKVHSIRNQQGQVDSASAILKYLQEGSSGSQIKPDNKAPASFTTAPQVHGSAKVTFNYVLEIFVKEINAVTENPAIFPDEDMVFDGGAVNAQHLSVALDILAVSITTVANISERRIHQLVKNQESLRPLSGMATGIVNDNKQLLVPASINYISVDNTEDFVNGAPSATKCLKVINNVEKVLALELMVAAKVSKLKTSTTASPFLGQFIKEYTQHVSSIDEDDFSLDKLTKSIEFIYLYKL